MAERTPLPAEPVAESISARILIAVGAQAPASWMDVIVDGTGADAQHTCEVLVRHRLGAVAPPVQATLGRACEPRALPELPRGFVGAYLLVTSEQLEGELLLTGDPGATSNGRIVQFSRHGSRQRCDEVRRRLEQDEVKERGERVAAVRAFVAHEIAEQEARVTRSCEEARARAAACGGMKANDRVSCELARDVARRDCTTTTGMLGSLRAHADAGSEVAPRDVGVCRPE